MGTLQDMRFLIRDGEFPPGDGDLAGSSSSDFDFEGESGAALMQETLAEEDAREDGSRVPTNNVVSLSPEFQASEEPHPADLVKSGSRLTCTPGDRPTRTVPRSLRLRLFAAEASSLTPRA